MPTPHFGRHLLSEFLLDPKVTYLNHGTVGVAPKRVLAVQQQLRDEMEREPSKFILREYCGLSGTSTLSKSRVRTAADAVGLFVGARGEDIVFVENATVGNMAVIRSLPIAEGEEILITDHEYGSTAIIAKVVAQERGATVVVAKLPYPQITPDSAFETIVSKMTSRTKLLVVNHVSSESAMRLPIERLALECKKRGMFIHIDAAHAIGLVEIDLATLGVDSYTSNIHKWGFAPKGTAFLWVKPELQHLIHPPVISWGYGKGFTTEFDWTGTRDVTGWLAAPTAIEFIHSFGFQEIRNYTHDLAWNGAMHLCDLLRTKMEVPSEMCTAMLTIPLPESLTPTFEFVEPFRKELLYKHEFEVQMHAYSGRVWMRLSAQIYNDFSDFERLGATLKRMIP